MLILNFEVDMRICSVDGCSRELKTRGLCTAHYKRLKKYGDPLGGGSMKGEALEWLRENLAQLTNDCLLWPFNRNEKGYAKINLNGKNQLVTRLVCEQVNGQAPNDKPLALHSCGNGKQGCINPKHLRWGTHSENVADMIKDGNSLRGTKNNQAKLTEDGVRAILQRIKEGEKSIDIARDLGLHPNTIYFIKSRKCWGWLNLPEQSCSEKCSDN